VLGGFLVKKYNYFFSALLLPAIVLQAGSSTTTTCTGGTGGSTPTINLPTGPVTGTQTINGAMGTLYNFNVTSASAGVFTHGANYPAYCSNTNGSIPQTSQTYTAYNTYQLPTKVPSGGNIVNLGSPGYMYNFVPSTGVGSYSTTKFLSLSEEWAAVNWIINNPHGVSSESPDATDIQAAIWQLLNSPQLQSAQMPAIVNANSWQLYQDAITNAIPANGPLFSPVSGQLVAVLLYPTSSTAVQGVIVPFPIPCTATGSATLTKTSSVSSSGANAFQLVTYTYTVKNTGSTTLGNINIVDDNGTPNYPEDDYTVPVPANTTITPGNSYSISTQVYLPISLFYQSGTEAAFDTLIPQAVPATATAGASLQLTYLIDTDVTDNSYGANASAGWAGNGGHSFADLEAGYAEFAFYNAYGTTMADFNVNYLKPVKATTAIPTGYGSTPGTIYAPTSLNTNYISYLTSTLEDDLNDTPAYNGDTTSSPVAGSPNWIFTAGYKVLVSNAIFGMFNSSFSVAVKKNYLAATETGFSGKCGSPRPITYTPTVYGSSITSTAWLCANVCGCSTVVHAKACLTVKMCGSSHPTCNNPGTHICQNPVHCPCTCAQCTAGNHGACTAKVKCTPPVCSCTCPQCQAGNHASCSKVGCTDPTCHANNCNHNTVRCTIASKPVTYCW
jgi:hypothetical protein